MNARRKQRQRHWQYKDAEDDAIAKEMEDHALTCRAFSDIRKRNCEIKQ